MVSEIDAYVLYIFIGASPANTLSEEQPRFLVVFIGSSAAKPHV